MFDFLPSFPFLCPAQGDPKFDWVAQQKNLPRLPLPSLKDTVARYLDQLEPLVDAAAFREAKKDGAEFLLPGGRGEALQVELEARNNANTQVYACTLVDLHVCLPITTYFAFTDVIRETVLGFHVPRREISCAYQLKPLCRIRA